MYIPVMAFVTYILLSTLLAGLAGNFQPELLGRTATTAFAIVIFEILGLKLGCYLLNISNESQLLDLVAYSGYKFVGIIVNMAASRLGSSVITWGSFLYTFASLAFFLVCLCTPNPNTIGFLLLIWMAATEFEIRPPPR